MIPKDRFFAGRATRQEAAEWRPVPHAAGLPSGHSAYQRIAGLAVSREPEPFRGFLRLIG
jgi:hypothetical protein